MVNRKDYFNGVQFERLKAVELYGVYYEWWKSINKREKDYAYSGIFRKFFEGTLMRITEDYALDAYAHFRLEVGQAIKRAEDDLKDAAGVAVQYLGRTGNYDVDSAKRLSDRIIKALSVIERGTQELNRKI